MDSRRIVSLCLGIATVIGAGPVSWAQMGGDNGLSTFMTNDFMGSGHCAMCHSNLRDSAGNDVSIDTHWRSTMMGNAGKDPLWQAKVSSEILRSPGVEAVINDKCTRCHTPMARVQALADGQPPVAMLGDGFFNPTNSLHEAAMESVSCTLCHQVADVNLGTPATFTGLYVIDTATVSPNRKIYGPYTNPLANPMKMHTGYTPSFGRQATDSALCGTCHTLYTPTVDADGSMPGEFPEQMTFLEWRHANATGGVTLSCQQCHMPAASGAVKISTMPMMLGARTPFGQHHFVGANDFMLGVLKDHSADLEVTATSAHFDATAGRLSSQLGTKTADLAIVSSGHASTGVLKVALKVTNKAGHKVPSGIPLRRCWLHVTVKDAAGSTVFESGQPLPDGQIAGNDADVSAAVFEPHYDEITQADQVQIYEPIMSDSAGDVTYTWLRAADYLKDNRLLPAGFDKTSAEHDIAVHGEATADGDFVGGSDQVTYRLSTAEHAGPYTVSAELLYQAVSYRIVQDLVLDSTPLISRFAGYYDAADKTPAVVATVGAVVNQAPALAGDTNDDGHVDVEDLLTLAASWGRTEEQDGYDWSCDFDGDGSVDVTDLLILAGNWGM